MVKTSRPVAPSALKVAMTSRRRSIWLLTALATPTPPTRSAARPTSVRNWVKRLMVRSSCGEALPRLRISLPLAGWEIRSRGNGSPPLERTISRFTQFLTLVGLAALLVGGVGVANAVKSHIDRRRDVIATFKALGATGR